MEGKEIHRSINCGGEVYGDFEKDLPVIPGTTEPRDLPCGDFYEDWARTQFGERGASEIAAIFREQDGKLPRPSNWVNGPGGITPDEKPWKEVSKDYEFVDVLAGLKCLVKGDGNRERFAYWLENFEYVRAMAEVRCIWAEYNQTIKEIQECDDLEERPELARPESSAASRQTRAQGGGCLPASIANSLQSGGTRYDCQLGAAYTSGTAEKARRGTRESDAGTFARRG